MVCARCITMRVPWPIAMHPIARVPTHHSPSVVVRSRLATTTNMPKHRFIENSLLVDALLRGTFPAVTVLRFQGAGDTAEPVPGPAAAKAIHTHTRGVLCDAGGDLEQPRARVNSASACAEVLKCGWVFDRRWCAARTHLIGERRTVAGAVGGKPALVQPEGQ
jgi:hypothetical protein